MLDVPRISLSSGFKMPAIGLGMYLTADESEVQRAVESALESGYRHIDSALMYQNEAYIGDALQKVYRRGGLKRGDLFITSKLPPNGLRPENVPYFFYKTMEDLQVDYLDLYLIHCPMATARTEDDYATLPMKNGALDTDAVDLVETWRVLEKLVEEGVVRSIGLSNFNSRQITKIYAAAKIKPAVLQVECHAYLSQFELQSFCKKLDMVITAYSPLGCPGSLGAGEDRLLNDERLKPIGEKYRKSPAQVLLRYLTQRNMVVIPKSSNPKRLAENIKIFDFKLSDEDMFTLMSMDKNKRYFSFESLKGMPEHPEYPFKAPY